MNDPTRIAVMGASGRMGTQILDVAFQLPGVSVGAALVPAAEAGDLLGPQQLPSSADVAEAVRHCDVVIDFSSPSGFDAALARCRELSTPLVSGTTGLSEEQRERLRQASEEIPVVYAANFSVGVNVLEHLVELGARALEGFDVEIFEAHHRHKVDAPSGTALFLGEAAARGRGTALDDVATWSRHGQTGARTDEEIGFQVVRGGSVVGEHTVFFCGEGERVELTHRAQDRQIFARGAVRAALWLVGKPAGRYSMKDVLFG